MKRSLVGGVCLGLSLLLGAAVGPGAAPAERTVTVDEQMRALERVLTFMADDPAPDVLEAFLLDEFDVVRSIGGGDGTMLVTGYHEVIVDAALRPSAEYRVPILGAPAGLAGRAPVSAPYPTRGRSASRRHHSAVATC